MEPTISKGLMRELADAGQEILDATFSSSESRLRAFVQDVVNEFSYRLVTNDYPMTAELGRVLARYPECEIRMRDCSGEVMRIHRIYHDKTEDILEIGVVQSTQFPNGVMAKAKMIANYFIEYFTDDEIDETDSSYMSAVDKAYGLLTKEAQL